jgi:phage baseplate assembly protein W
MKTSTADALGRWEKRLKVERAEITQGERSTTAAITLRPRGTGESRVVEVSSG